VSTAVIPFALAFVLFIVAPLLGLLPRVKHNSDQSRNTLLGVTIRYKQFYDARGVQVGAIVAQEVVEFWIRWAVTLPLASPVLLFADGIHGWAASAIAIMLASIWSVPGYAQLDLIGRAVEVLYDGRPGYLEAEAERLRRGTTRNFASYSTTEIAAKIEARFWIARPLLRLLRRRIASALPS
jgi:hypothetical protein